KIRQNPWFWLALGLAAILLRGLWLNVMDVDASQYASISMEMLQHSGWLEVKHRGADYLDKPPLLFWSSALSFALFGLSNWAYKLPSLLAALAGVFAVYRFSLLYYGRQTALHAAFILASCIGLILICNDVRTDTWLLGMTACAIWMFTEYLHENARNRAQWLIGAFAFVGLAMLAKGPIGLVMPGFAVGTQLLLQRNWKQIFDWRWLPGLLVTALVLVPMCWGLYHQYDLHPEKTINDRSGVSGLYFFFWEQSFGRITGENVWKNNAPWYYFLHVYLWAFLPWSLLLIMAVWQRLRNLIQQKFRLPAGDEAFSIGAFLLTFVALSLSKYKLPHYVFVTLPWAAVLTARLIASAGPKLWVWMTRIQYFVYGVLALAAVLMPAFVFPTTNSLVWGALLMGILGLGYRIYQAPNTTDKDRFVQRGLIAVLIAAGSLNFYFYPNLLPYQSTSALMQAAREQHIPADKIVFFRRHGHALDFYNGQLLEKMDSVAQIRQTAIMKNGIWVYTNLTGKTELEQAGVPFEVTMSFNHFQVALLKPAFLNPAARARTLDPVFLLCITYKGTAQ
ncbi:MAG: glycosyltransferase family 39 protein, partial [Bacteroidota bacterium]